MNVNVVFSSRDRHVLHALPAALWLGASVYTALSMLNALPPMISGSSPLSVRNVAVIALCMLLMYPVYRLGYMLISRQWPEAPATKRIAAMSLICMVLGATILVSALFSVDQETLTRGLDPRWHLLNLLVGILLMPGFFLLIRGADSVREQITGTRTGAIRFLLRKAGADASARLVRLQSADHYVELHTDTGAKLLLMRISDAVEMLTGAEGAQVHRSHWINFEEVSRVIKKDRKVWLRMSDGSNVPVSRKYRAPLRAAGVI
ncbi:MAG: LytTR family DNA-binding domain-containing protein [Pseudomonadota bacterium]